MFETAIRYLADSDDGVETVLVGGILTLLSWLLIPGILVAGYLQRVLARTNAGDPAPSFDDWGDLFGEGLKAIAVALAYLAVPVVLLTAVVASVLVASVETTVVTDPATVADPATTVEPSGFGLLALLGGLALAVVTWLAAWYALPAALARLAIRGRLGEAFEFRKLGGVLATESYATGWLIALVVIVVGGVLVGGLASIPFVGWVLVPFAAFYVNVVAFALYGQAYREATRTGRREVADGTQQTSA